MNILPSNKHGIATALRVLASGGIVAHATETCYGLACDLTNPAAVGKLFAMKRRPGGQPVSALFPSISEAKHWVLWNLCAEGLAKHLPGPLTLILEIRSDAPETLYPAGPNISAKTLGMRVSLHPIAMALAETFGKPISTTSANIHGASNPYTVEDILPLQPDLILDSGSLPMIPPSTIMDCTKDGSVLLRKGTL